MAEPARRPTRQRPRSPTLLSGTDDFPSAQDLHARLRGAGETVGLATVYRTLQALADAGEVDVLRTDDGEAVYRRCSTGATTTTWSAAPAGAPSRSRARPSSGGPTRSPPSTASPTSRHTLEIFGTCADCAAAGR